MIPSWLDPDSWSGFVEMRKSIPKIPFTARAQMLILKELQSLKDQGYDPNKCLDQSTMNGWRGVFPTKTSGKPQSTYEESRALIEAMERDRKASQSPESMEARRKVQELAGKMRVVR